MLKLLLRFLLVMVILAHNPQNIGFADGNTTNRDREKVVNVYDFIMQYECRGGPRALTAYWDHKGYSIGCGTPSYYGERITREEALMRFRAYTDKRIALVKKDFPHLTGDRQTALVSLAGNNGTCYAYHKKHGLTEAQWRACDKVRVGGKLVPLRGLTIRRNAEADMYFLENKE